MVEALELCPVRALVKVEHVANVRPVHLGCRLGEEGRARALLAYQSVEVPAASYRPVRVGPPALARVVRHRPGEFASLLLRGAEVLELVQRHALFVLVPVDELPAVREQLVAREHVRGELGVDLLFVVVVDHGRHVH